MTEEGLNLLVGSILFHLLFPPPNWRVASVWSGHNHQEYWLIPEIVTITEALAKPDTPARELLVG